MRLPGLLIVAFFFEIQVFDAQHLDVQDVCKVLQKIVAGLFYHYVVKCLVQALGTVQIGSIAAVFHGFVDPFHLPDILFREGVPGELKRQGMEFCQHNVGFFDLVVVESRYPALFSRLDLDELLIGQQLHSFAHGGAADGKVFRDLLVEDLLAGLQRAVHDPFS